MNKIVIIAAALLAAPLAATAEAQAPAGDRTQADRTRIVSYVDLDLTRGDDVRKLDRRIGRAVKQVCGTASDINPEGKNQVRRCRALTRESLAAERRQALASAGQRTQVASASRR